MTKIRALDLNDNVSVITISFDQPSGKNCHLYCFTLFSHHKTKTLKNLIGSIDSRIGNLSQLILLQMDNNHLTSTIPTEIGKLEKLSKINEYFFISLQIIVLILLFFQMFVDKKDMHHLGGTTLQAVFRSFGNNTFTKIIKCMVKL